MWPFRFDVRWCWLAPAFVVFFKADFDDRGRFMALRFEPDVGHRIRFGGNELCMRQCQFDECEPAECTVFLDGTEYAAGVDVANVAERHWSCDWGVSDIDIVDAFDTVGGAIFDAGSAPDRDFDGAAVAVFQQLAEFLPACVVGNVGVHDAVVPLVGCDLDGIGHFAEFSEQLSTATYFSAEVAR